MKHIISALVENKPGVLAHVAGMFAARGFNIDSLVVGRTESPELSRMTIVAVGDDRTLEQVRKQLAKVVSVVRVRDFKDVDYVERDLMLLRVSVPPERRAEIVQLTSLFRGRVVDVARRSLTIELSGPEEKLEAFIDLARPYGIRELARTGVIAMQRGRQGERKAVEEAETG
jgi:acetolactate synthase-1/3 small subunit